jgi:hypothetical protein
MGEKTSSIIRKDKGMIKSLEELSKELDNIPRKEMEEMEYRRGYHDGFAQAIEAFYSSRLGKEKTYDALYAFWQRELFEWSRHGNMKNRSEFPPEAVLKKTA